MGVVIMTGNQNQIQWARTHKRAGNGAKNAKSGRKIDTARQDRADRLASILKDFLGTDGFISARDRGAVITFRLNGEEIAEAESHQDFDNDDCSTICVIADDEEAIPVPLAAMAAQASVVSRLDKGVRRQCWVVKTVGGDGSATYAPAGLASVNGEAMPLRESAARSAVAMQLAWAMSPKSGRDGKRVKANIRRKDGKGTRYAFRIAGSDIAEWYHDGRFCDLGGAGRTIEDYLAKTGIQCVLPAEAEDAAEEAARRLKGGSRPARRDEGLAGKIASLMDAPGFKAADVAEDAEPYEDDEDYFARVSAAAVKAGLINKGKSIEDFDVVVKKNGMFILVNRKRPDALVRQRDGSLAKVSGGGAAAAEQGQTVDVEPEFGDVEPSIVGYRAAKKRGASRPSQAAAPAAIAKVAVAVPAA